MKCENYCILALSNSSQLHMLTDFLTQKFNECPNLIINILDFNIDKQLFITKIFPFHLNWEKRNKSFILVSSIEDSVLNGVISINSLEEAIDYFHMEELTRNI